MTMKRGKSMVSLIVPVYNEAPFLKRCFDSIKNQTVPFGEVIVVDDCSTDGSREIVQAYKGAIRALHSVNLGVSVSRNDGLSDATGEYVTFLDADDELMPDAHEKMLKAIKEHPMAPVIQFNHLRHYAKINKTVKKYDNREGWYGISDIESMQGWWGVWNKVIWRKAIKYPFRPDMRYGEDGIWILEHLLYGWSIWQEDTETVIHHFENENSLTKSKTKEQLQALEKVQRELLEAHCSLGEPWENIRAIVGVIEKCKNDPNYQKIMKGNGE